MSSIAIRVPTLVPEQNLHVQRALAVLSVVLCHLVLVWRVPIWAHMFAQAGVLIFFFHTAFVLSGSIERLGADERDTHSWALEFELKRFLRIYPLEICTIILVVVGGFPHNAMVGAQEIVGPTLPQILANMSLFQNVIGIPVVDVAGKVLLRNDIYVVLWTLPLEVQMYLVLPLCYLAQKKGGKYLAALVLVSVVLGVLRIMSGHVPIIWRSVFDLFDYAPCFMAGVVAFYLIRVRRWKPFLPAWGWPIALVLWTCFYAATGLKEDFVIRWAYCFGLAVMLPSFRDFDLGAARTASRWLFAAAKYIAERSFGFYLFNMLAFDIVWRGREQSGIFITLGLAVVFLLKSQKTNKTTMTLMSVLALIVLLFRTPSAAFDLTSFLLSIGVMVVMVVAGYDFIEAPAMKYGRRFGKKSEQGSMGVSATFSKLWR